MTRPLDLPSSHSSPNTLIELYLLYFYLLLLYLLFLYLIFPLPPRSIMSEVSAASPEPPATATASASPFLVIQDHSLWHDGDFVLMSSDGWRFRVLSHHLFSASPVLRDAPSTGLQQIEFTDEVLERAVVIDLALNLIVHNRLTRDKYDHLPRQPNDDCEADEDDEFDDTYPEYDGNPPALSGGQLNLYCDVILFLQKWDCAAALRAFGLGILELLVMRRIRPADALTLGMLSSDADLCAATMSSTIGCKTLRLANFPLRVWERAEPRFLWAMGMARELQVEGEDLGSLFLQELQVAEEGELSKYVLQGTEGLTAGDRSSTEQAINRTLCSACGEHLEPWTLLDEIAVQRLT
ncbi:hypothetical protein A1Q1_05457 [Trichosporon asahii var. asahii CBS 2479]|uniref:BTB domain-containing protein n=1 Tax=Trichosporon asahii var. asahii (strain ATCC 90039 / CBS 2479 / JCM 2466 / KCTC 7840 / NBRC 103889/ NCYC 2677 / UAMH 7654) TaxID=1186058 RepID=J6FAM0_TRIAS|nr:hypothetical protein A1Q1_05457 [Trichosporon asahii var. asahii CBS 2479]EJT52247.1 hypothetical protein A1Q1_05457 [Trichosporon asahii var. asahii CBS 2479]